MKVHGMKFASLGPFKVVFEPVTFQRLCPCLHGCERGKTALASAGTFKFAPAATRMSKSPSACLVHLVYSVCLVCLVYLVEPD